MSGGQQQRVGVARALVVDPEIIFADEPTGNLDSNTSKEVMELMQQVVHEKQQTLVMVTHDNHLASFADRIFHIIDGKIVRIDDMTGKSKEERERKKRNGRKRRAYEKLVQKLLTAGLIFMTAVAAVKTPMPVYADEVSGNSVQYITDDDRWRASVELKTTRKV